MHTCISVATEVGGRCITPREKKNQIILREYEYTIALAATLARQWQIPARKSRDICMGRVQGTHLPRCGLVVGTWLARK